MEKLLLLKTNWIIIFIAAVLLTGCSKISEKKNYAAKVNDSYLSEEEINKQTDSTSKLYRNEVVNRWVEDEILYQEALKNNIEEDPAYTDLVNSTKRKLAIEMLLQKKSKELNIAISDDELIDYYNSHKNDFVAGSETYIINKASFQNENEAIDFRNMALSSGWNNTASYKKVENNKIIYADEVSSLLMMNLLKELYPNEVSIIFKDDNSKYTVIQLLKKFEEGTIMPFEIIKEDVKGRYKAIKMKQSIQQYIEQLYPKYEIEIREKK